MHLPSLLHIHSQHATIRHHWRGQITQTQSNQMSRTVRIGWQCYELSAPMIIGHQVHKTCVPEVTQRAFIIPACAKTRHCDFFQMAHVKMTENVSECLFCPTK